MTIEELNDYRNWLNLTPAQVLAAVRLFPGGWQQVFQSRLPPWAHRVRNYFDGWCRRVTGGENGIFAFSRGNKRMGRRIRCLARRLNYAISGETTQRN